MNNEINYKHNPLNGVSLKQMMTELVDHYDYEILFAYLNLNCFNNNPSIASSVKFLKKADWAREKVEAFYMYQYKNLPKASEDQFLLPPRDRVVPEGDKPGSPAKLSLEDAERLREKRAHKAAARGHNKPARTTNRTGSETRSSKAKPAADKKGSSPWDSLKPK